MLIGTSLIPPEPVRALSVHLVRAASELAPLPRWLENQPLTAMSPSARQLAWAVGRHVTRNPDHGFAMSRRVPASAVGFLWDLYRCAPTLESIHRAYPDIAVLLLDDVPARITEEPSSVRLDYAPAPPLRLDRAEQDFRAAWQVKTWRELHLLPEMGARSACFTYARPRSTVEHERLLGTRELRFSQPHFALELDRRWWEAPLPKANSGEFGERLKHAAGTARAFEQLALEQRVESLITQLLSSDASAGKVAELLGISVRTLHRKLTERGFSFRFLSERARRREADLVEQTEQIHGAPAVSSDDRARMLGFSNGRALRNAVRRWRAG
jgi:AraC-like DNA-binding protein